MSEQMTREETREMFSDLKDDLKAWTARVETKIDTTAENIDKYAKDTIVHGVELSNLKKDVKAIADKQRENNKRTTGLSNKMYWASGVLASLIFGLRFFVK